MNLDKIMPLILDNQVFHPKNFKRKKTSYFGKYKYETHVSLTNKTNIGALKHQHEWETVPSLTMIIFYYTSRYY